MVVVALAAKQQEVPDVDGILTDADTLAAAFHLAYLAGRADSARDRETYQFLHRSIRNMQRSIRKARPIPREGIEAGLDLMLRAVEERLGVRAEDALGLAA